MIEHEDARAALEIAAVEPGGLDRLAAGDTGEAMALANHLAGCADCMDEMTRLRRADMLLRPAIAMSPPPELRARTLEYVRALGRERGASGAAPAGPEIGRATTTRGGASDPSRPAIAPPRLRRAAWPAAVAAALVIGLVGGLVAAGGRSAPDRGDAVVALTEVSHETAALLGASDAARVTLRDSAGTARGSIVVARSAGRMVAVAVDLPDPGAGREYRCWVEVGGARTRLGTMWLSGSVAWWNGPVALPSGVGPGSRFGVSLVTVGSAGPGDPILAGVL